MTCTGPSREWSCCPGICARPACASSTWPTTARRRSLYGIVLTRGRRNDLARFVNARLLRQDWQVLSDSLDPKIRRGCERWLNQAS